MKVFLALIIIGICYGQSDSLIQLGNGATLQNLDILAKLNMDELNCQTNLVQLSHQFKMWAELLQDEKVIHKEIKVLSNTQQDIKQLTFNRHRFSETLKKAKIVLATLKQNTHKNQHTLYQQWRQNEISIFKKEIKLLQTSTTQSDSTECCERIEKLVNKVLDERKHISNQCNDPKITINVINDKENTVKIINKTCKDDDNSIKVNKVDSKNVIVGQSQQQKKEKVEGKDFDGKIDGHGNSKFESKQAHEKQEEHEIKDGTIHGEGIHGEYEKFEVEEHEVEDEDDFDGNVDGEGEYDDGKFEFSEYGVEEGEYMTGEIGGSVVEYSEDEYTQMTKTTTTQKVTKPPVEDDDEVEGELVSVQGVGASGEKGRQ